MSSRRAGAAALLLSCLLHAAILWRTARLEIARPADPNETPPVQVVLRQPPPPPPAPPARRPPPPPAPPPPAADAVPDEPEAAQPEAEKPPELEVPLPEQQIVAVPDGGREEPPPDTRFLSDRDNRVEEQMVRKGEPEASREEPNPAAGDDGDGEKAEEKPAAPPLAAKPPLPGLNDLLPGALALASRQRDLPLPEPTAPAAATGAGRRVRRAEDWQPQTTLRGSLDYLPDVQPGHLTLLNTKADLFAPFVRRVMVRVFQNMLILLRRAAPSIRGGRERVQAEAVMDPSGAMLTITIQERSTTMAIGLDRMLREACDAAFFDRNPPPGAESADGNIHFVLETVIEAVPGPRGVEISGVFGVGLL